MTQSQWRMDTLVGPLYLVASATGLQEIMWDKRPVPMVASLKGWSPEIKILTMAVRELEEYFAGERKTFSVPVETQGTPFQKKVWHELNKIPYGETVSYSDVAKRIRNDKAVRAVGTANSRNPISIITPCHRVIAADGTLGGYGGGLANKTKLLMLEGVNI